MLTSDTDGPFNIYGIGADFPNTGNMDVGQQSFPQCAYMHEHHTGALHNKCYKKCITIFFLFS